MIKSISFILFFLIIAVPAGIYDNECGKALTGVKCGSNMPADGAVRVVGKVSALLSPYHKIIQIKARKYRISPSLIYAMILVESSGRSRAISRKGAKGLMQLMPSTARQMNVKDPLNPEENIEGGIKYLRHLLDRFNGNISHALAAYNAGPRRVRKFGGIPPFKETQQYVKKVLSLYSNANSQDNNVLM